MRSDKIEDGREKKGALWCEALCCDCTKIIMALFTPAFSA